MLTRRLLSLTAGCALFAASGAWAQEVVWDAAVNPDLPSFIDQEFGDFPDFSSYLVHHIVLDRKTAIFDITTYFTNVNLGWPLGAVDARLNIFDQVGSLPDNGLDNPEAGTLVTANIANNGDLGLTVTASLGGGLELQAGEYWIGLTPILDFLVASREFHRGTDFFLKNSAGRNPGGGFKLGTDWFDAGNTFGDPPFDWGGAITITGVPTPGALALLGVAGLLGTRRRRPQ